MSIERIYRCNLCREPMSESRNLVGIHFTSGDGIEQQPYTAVENHICEPCLVGLVIIHRKRDNTPPRGD